MLEAPRTARRVVVVLLLIHSGLLAYSAYVHSPTLNEPGHLVTGLSNWKFGRFDVYSVNPPLVRMVAALPVMVAGYKEDWSGFYTGPGARPEFAMGEEFVAANGERSFFLFMIARWACIPFSWIGAIVCYLWARDLYGRPAGVIACSIWCFEPNILAHASLMTPDAHATALGLAACYTFWRWLKKPTWTQAALTGVVLGLAELAKTTLILFYPLWPLMWIIYRLMERRTVAISLREMNDRPKPLAEREDYTRRMTPCDWLREGGMLALRMAIGLYILNLGYGFEDSLKPLDQFHFVSNLFKGEGQRTESRESAESQATSLRSTLPAATLTPDTRHLTPSPHNRFAGSWLAAIPVPFPANYLLGIDLQQKDFEHYGRPSYLRGEWRDQGWWYYYLYAAAIKVPLGLWALAAIALVLRLIRRLPTAHRPMPASFRDELILLLPPLIIFAVVSSKTGFNEHFRYVLPSFPFAFVWISSSFRNFVDIRDREGVACARGMSRTIAKVSITLSSVLLLWPFASSLWIYPHSLSYFNEWSGGPLHGANHLLGSSLDWGQDLMYLNAAMVSQGPGTRFVAYHGSYQPGAASALIRNARTPGLGKHDDSLNPGTYAVSLEALIGRRVSWSGQGQSEHWNASWRALLSARAPRARGGYSTMIYRIVGEP